MMLAVSGGKGSRKVKLLVVERQCGRGWAQYMEKNFARTNRNECMSGSYEMSTKGFLAEVR